MRHESNHPKGRDGYLDYVARKIGNAGLTAWGWLLVLLLFCACVALLKAGIECIALLF